MKELIKSAVLFTSLLATTSASATLMVNADVTVFQKTEFGHVFADGHYENYNETSNVLPRSANLLFSLDFENSQDVRFSEFEDEEYYSFEYVWDTTLNPVSVIGPFQEDLMQLLIPENYDDSYGFSDIMVTSALRRNSGFITGQDSIQLTLSYSAGRDIFDGNTFTSYNFSYFQSLFFTEENFSDSIDDLKLSNKASVFDYLIANQNGAFEYQESASVSESVFDSETWESISSNDMAISYEGVGYLTIINDVPEPGMIALALLALGGIVRKRVR